MKKLLLALWVFACMVFFVGPVLLTGSVAVFAQDPPAVTTTEIVPVVDAATTEEQAAPDAGDVTAPPDNTWTVPYGSMIDGYADVIKAVITAALTAALGYVSVIVLPMLPIGIRSLVGLAITKLGDKLIANAVDYAVNATKGATKDGVLNIPVGAEVIARAGERAVSAGFPWLVKQLGGRLGIEQKVFRTINLPLDADEVSVGLPATTMGSETRDRLRKFTNQQTSRERRI